MREQKVIQVGNSLAVTLPSEFVKKSKVKAGQKVLIDYEAKKDWLQIRTSKQAAALSPQFKDWLEEVEEKYSSLVEKLAKA